MALALMQNSDGDMDLVIDAASGALVTTDNAVQPALMISLLCDRALSDDDLTASVKAGEKFPTRGGYWADMIEGVAGDLALGSHWWRRQKLKPLDSTRSVVVNDADVALSWFVSDEIARDVALTGEFATYSPTDKTTSNDRGVTLVVSFNIALINGTNYDGSLAASGNLST